MNTPTPTLILMRTSRNLLLTLLVGIAASTATLAADSAASSAEKASQALATLKSDAPPEEKAAACKRLAVFGGPDAVPALAPLLGDEHLAAWARIPLEVMPGPAADDALRDAATKLYGNLLVGVINSIGVRRDVKAVELLTQRLKDANADVAAAAAVALGRIGNPAAVAALTPSLAAAPDTVRNAVAEGLILSAERLTSQGQAGEAIQHYEAVRRANVPKQRILEATRGAILARQTEGLPLLLEALRSADRDLFGIGLRTARELPGRTVSEALAGELNRAPAERQSALLLALADRGDEAVWPAVFDAVKQGAKPLRLSAIGVLERVGTVSAVPALIEAAADKDSEIAKASKLAVARLSGKEVDVELAKRLPMASGETRRVLVELVGQRRVSAMVPELFKAAVDPDAELRSAATKALGETIAMKDLGTLADLLAKAKSEDDLADVEAALDSACSRLPDKTSCVAPLTAQWDSKPTPVRCALLRVLGTVGAPVGLAPVLQSLYRDDAALKDTAFRVLAEWPEPSALPSLITFARGTTNDTQRTLALRGIVRLLGSENQNHVNALETYGDLVKLAKRVDDRKLVLSGLGNMSDLAAAKLVEPMLAESAIRKEAEFALLGIAEKVAPKAPAEAKALATRVQTESQDAATRDRAAQVLKRMEKR
ncbi:MAG: HEAT repeat domain-containing protein [Verrucomicrobiales bacterium]|nr:HEAT repeat domain-containing protein [Verrucomicrobiales bacterium]